MSFTNVVKHALEETVKIINNEFSERINPDAQNRPNRPSQECVPKDKFFYLRDVKGVPGVCVALSYEGHVQGEASVGFSIWNGWDKFNKTVGRNVALGRAKNLRRATAQGIVAKNYSFMIKTGKNGFEDTLSALRGMLSLANDNAIPKKLIPYLEEMIASYEMHPRNENQR